MLGGCWYEKQGTHRRNQKTIHDPLAVANAVQDVAPGEHGNQQIKDRTNKVSSVKSKVNELGFPLLELKLLFEHGNQNPIRGRNETPEKPYAHQRVQSTAMAGRLFKIVHCL